MKKLPASAADITGLFFDIDDTFISEEGLEIDALTALNRLSDAGFRLIALTGRSVGWVEPLVRLLPIEAAIAENGALCWAKRGKRTLRVDSLTEEKRAERRAKLAELVQEVRRELPDLVPADDTDGRISDFAFDIGEHQSAPAELIDRAIKMAIARGASAMLSSIHLHLSYDRTDKAQGAVGFLNLLDENELDPSETLRRWAFIGDSQNDASAFAAFKHSACVSNIRGQFSLPPRYRMSQPRSAGFAEFADLLLDTRKTPKISGP